MKRLLALTLAATIAAGPAFAQSVPYQEQNLIDVLSRYNQLYDEAPNSIQQDRIRPEFAPTFCNSIPYGHIYNWTGIVWTIDAASDGGVELDVQFPNTLITGSLGIDLEISNAAWQFEGEEPASTAISATSPLYNTVSSMKQGDTVVSQDILCLFKMQKHAVNG